MAMHVMMIDDPANDGLVKNSSKAATFLEVTYMIEKIDLLGESTMPFGMMI